MKIKTILQKVLSLQYLLSISFAFYISLANAQSPGGVSTSLKAWYKADGNVTTSGTTITGWNNQVSGGINLSNVKGTPTLSTAGLNFNPTVQFKGLPSPNTDLISSNTGTLGSNFFSASNNSMFIVFTSALPTSSPGVMAKWESSTANRASWEITSNGKLRFDFPKSGNTGNPSINGTKSSSSLVNQYSFIGSGLTNGNTDTLLINGLAEAIQASEPINPTLGGLLQLGGNYATGSFPLVGQISEVIYFDSHLSISDRQRVESYLAIKYGITLGNTTSPVTYLASDLITKPWIGSSTYQNNVAGIGRDDNAGLNQKQSTSVNETSLVTMSLGDIKASNAENTNSFSVNKSFLLWGDDNGALTSTGVTDLPAGIPSRIARVWQTQETGTVGAVRFRYLLKGTSLGNTCIDYKSIRLLVDKDAVFASGAKIIAPIAYDSIAQYIDFNIDFNSTDGYYFSLGSTQALGAPIVNNVSACQFGTQSPLTAVGNNLKWYTSASGGTGSATAPTPSTATVGTQSFWVTQSFGYCESTRAKIDFVTKPFPTVTSGSNQTVCTGGTTNISLSSNIVGTTFSWVAPTQINATGGTASTGTPTNIVQTLSGTTSTIGTVKYLVRGTFNLCTGPVDTVTITVNPKPQIDITTTDTTICSGSATNITLKSSVAGSTFTWGTPLQTKVSGATASVGAQNKITQTLTATDTVQGLVRYIVTTTANNCSGATDTIFVKVNPKPVVTANDTTICSGATTNINLKSSVGEATFSWISPTLINATGGTASTDSPTKIVQTLSTTTTSAGAVRYVVVATANGCISANKVVNVTVNPKPILTANDATICSGNTTDILLSSNVASSTFAWTVNSQSNVSGASASTGSPTKIAQTLSTTGNTSGSVVYNVFTTAQNCNSDAKLVTVTVNPRPVISANDTTICSGSPVNIKITSSVANTSFVWATPTQVNANGGTASTANQTVISNTLNTTNNIQGTVSYSIAGTANNCTSVSPKVVLVRVNPIPVISASDATICSGATTNIPLSSNVANTNFTWLAPNEVNAIGGTAGTGNNISQTLNATTTSSGNVTYLVNASASACKSAEKTVIVTVNPKPIIGANDTTICSGSPINIKLKSNVGGTSFTWKSPTQTNASGASASVGNPTSINQTISATDIFNGTVVYKIIANASSCIDSTQLVTVTVKPRPVISVNDTSICSGATANLSIQSNIPGTTFSWNNPTQTNITGGTSGNTSLLSQTLTNATNFIGKAEYVISPIFNSCAGKNEDVTITVNPIPTITATASEDTICNGEAITLNGVGGVNYVWDNGVTNNVAFNPTTTATYNLIGTDVNGCKNNASIQIVVNQLPTITINATPTSVCLGGSAIVRGIGAVSYVWDKGIQNNVAFSPTVTDTYTVIGTDANGCKNTASVEITVTGNVPPNITAISSNNDFCVGGTTKLTASGADSYIWDFGVTNDVVFTPDSTRQYTVIGTASNGCQGVAQVTVKVNQKPIIIPIASKDSICNGSPLTLKGSGAVSYVWDNGVNDNVAFNPISTETYNVTGTDANGCVGTASKTVVVNQLPIVVANSLRDTVCAGGFTKLFGAGALSYTWDNGVTDNVLFSPLATTTYTVTGTDANKCKNTATKQIVVTANVPPLITASATEDSVCAGESTILTASGADSYVWNNGVTDNVSFTPDSTRTYTVVGTNANGCNNIATIDVIVHQLPTITVTTLNDSICENKLLTLKGNGASTYVWDNGVVDNVPFKPNGTQKYIVEGTDIFGCKNDTNITVVVNTLPTVTASRNKSIICFGDSVILSGNGAKTYTWDNGVIDNKQYIPSGTKIYTVTGADAFGCEDTDTISVTIKDLPNVTATASNDSICLGGSTKLTGNGAVSYVWDNNVVDNVAFSPNFTQTYTVTGLGANNCSNTATVKVTVTNNIAPVITATATEDTVCFGTNTTLIGGGNAVSFVWDKNVVNNTPFTPDSTRIYTVTGTSVRGCKGTAIVQVTVNQLPKISIIASEDSVCMGNTTTLNGAGAQTYTWNNGITNNIAFAPTNSKKYTVIGTDIHGCKDSTSIDLVVNTLPVVKANASFKEVCSNDAVFLSATGANTYTWDNGVLDNTIFNPTSTKTYTVTGTDINKCSSTDTITVKVNALPNVKATATSSKICFGNTTLLKGNGAFSYTWSNGIVDSVAFTPSTTKKYFVIGIDAKGCKNIDSIQVKVDTLPLAPKVTNVSICKNSIIVPDLNTKVIGSNIKWYNTISKGTPLASTPLVDVNTVSAISYFVTQTDVNGCESSPITQINVEVKELPKAEIVASQASYCKGKENGVTLNAQAVNGATYQWFKNGTLQSETNSTINNVKIGDWILEVTQNGCKDTSTSFKVSEKQGPTPAIIASGLDYCAGTNNVNLAVNDTNSAILYQWFNNGNFQSTNKVINSANAGSWTLAATINGCSDTTLATVITEKPLPDAIILNTADSLNYYTGKKGVNLIAKNAGIGATYTWYKDGLLFKTTTTDTLTDAKKGNWSLIVNKNGCSNEIDVNVDVIELNLDPVALDDTLITDYLTTITFKITQNDYDPDGIIINNTADLNVLQTGLQQTIIKKDTGVVFVDQGGFLTFVPDVNFTGTAVFKYTVNDNTGNTSNIANIVISVGPHIFRDYKVVTMNTNDVINVLANDISKNGFDISSIDLDPSTSGVQSTFTKAGFGTFSVNNDGTVSFVPEKDKEITDSIFYQLKDLKGAKSNIASIVIKVRSEGVIIPDGFSPNGDNNHDVLSI